MPDCLGGLSRVGISSRSTRPWNGQPPSSYKDTECNSYQHEVVVFNMFGFHEQLCSSIWFHLPRNYGSQVRLCNSMAVILCAVVPVNISYNHRRPSSPVVVVPSVVPPVQRPSVPAFQSRETSQHTQTHDMTAPHPSSSKSSL